MKTKIKAENSDANRLPTLKKYCRKFHMFGCTVSVAWKHIQVHGLLSEKFVTDDG